ncbi:ABC transporter permease [Stappia taiwanensis]|uniref:ABC transporter permease n=1 Tax=Stappia taiwanensis TaxID=992267 RepID=A0A838Y2J7_9HYPH|nr:ABC transporter permease [Stappia taiwanensis]MBA4613140.1 ABC transporter permease [Stappia taiwanensis]GGE80183.1 ABC transporter permease [Stappia taiwanensis]
MRLELEKRAEHSRTMAVLSPLLALVLTLISGAIMFALLGQDPVRALYTFFIEPLTASWSLQELVVKAAPLILIAVGLAVCYLSNTWNIGAEGQFTFGAIAGSLLPIVFPGFESPLTLPLMLLMGIAGGMLWGAIPAFLKIRFGANEILTSLMLVYVAQLFLDWLVRGPWRDPEGFNFPESRLFSDAAILQPLADGRMHVGALFALLAVIAMSVILMKTLKGFEVRVLGQAPRAGQFAGFSRNKMVLFAFLLSGGLAGLAGISEVSGSINQLTPVISPGYGFTAIIVAFLGRLNPIGIFIAGFLLALSYLGGEAAQVSLGLSDKTTRVFQGMLLFYVLACDTLILYRIRLTRAYAPSGKEA